MTSQSRPVEISNQDGDAMAGSRIPVDDNGNPWPQIKIRLLFRRAPSCRNPFLSLRLFSRTPMIYGCGTKIALPTASPVLVDPVLIDPVLIGALE